MINSSIPQSHTGGKSLPASSLFSFSPLSCPIVGVVPITTIWPLCLFRRVALVCEHCGLPLNVPVVLGWDMRRLLWTHSHACFCQLPRHVLTGLLLEMPWAMGCWNTWRRDMALACELPKTHRHAFHQFASYPLPDAANETIAALLDFYYLQPTRPERRTP